MLKLNKEYYLGSVFFLLVLFFVFLFSLPLQAAKSLPYQVKLANSPVVYFLHYGSHHKKAYLNADSYLSYNNKWSDVKIISAKELAAWSDIKLMKTGAYPSVYYVSGNHRAKLNNRDDLESFGFLGEPILNVSEKDLNQYRLVSYEEIGLTSSEKSNQEDPTVPNDQNSNNSNNSDNANSTSTPEVIPEVSAANLLVYSDPVKISGNTLVTNTDDNLLGIFRFKADDKTATLTSLTFVFGGIFNSSLLDQALVRDKNNNIIETNNNVRVNDKQLVINFKDAVVINPGEEKTFKVYMDFNSCDCNNQTIRLDLLKASDIKTNLTPIATWPLQGNLFKLLAADNLLGQLTIQELSLAGASYSSGGGILAKFVLAETSGKEDVLIKKITFKNSGTAYLNDLNNFRLTSNNQVVSRVSEINSDGLIAFDINYLRISKMSSSTLSVSADLKSGYNNKATVDLQAIDLIGTGQSYNLSLPIVINNLNEIITLN